MERTVEKQSIEHRREILALQGRLYPVECSLSRYVAILVNYFSRPVYFSHFSPIFLHFIPSLFLKTRLSRATLRHFPCFLFSFLPLPPLPRGVLCRYSCFVYTGESKTEREQEATREKDEQIQERQLNNKND